MLINVKVIPRAKKILVKEEGGSLKIYLTAPASEGKANHLLIEVLSEHFKVSKFNIRILRGEKSRQKIVEVNGIKVGQAK